MFALSLGLAATPAGADTGGSSVALLQTQARELAGQIQADNQTLDQLDEKYNAAEITYAQQQAKQAQLAQQIAASAAEVAIARQNLKNEAILAYLTGGAPIIQGANEMGDRADLTLAYASIVASGEKADVTAYETTLATQAHQQADMAATVKSEAVTLADITSVRSQAATALTAQQAALSQVKGQLAVAVADVQAQQQAAEQAQYASRTAATPSAPPTRPAAPTAVASTPSVASSPSGGPTPSVGSTTAAPVRPTAPASVATTGAPATTTAHPPTTTAPVPPSSGSSGASSAQAPGVGAVLAYARAQIGKPYQWGGAGPDSFDCSGLVMMAWDQAGIYFPHSAQDQYDMTARVPLSAMIPGDLVFYGTPDDVYHVGIYVGNGKMIAAPETGQNVQEQGIYWGDLLGGGRVTTSS